MAGRKKNNLVIDEGNALPLGVMVMDNDRVNFAVEAELKAGEMLWVEFYDNKGECVERLKFPEGQRLGDVHYIGIYDLDVQKYGESGNSGSSNSYKLIAVDCEGNERTVLDKRAMRTVGREKWSDWGRGEVKNGFVCHDFDWQGDLRPGISHSDLIIYRLHVRGFTMHESSQVEAKGTFRGIIEKIPYLKELGINYVELMPAYEFDELGDVSGKVNYWGYAAKSAYMAPKASYAISDAVKEFKELVRELHKAGIELGMEFYFEQGMDKQFVVEILRYWAAYYHVDGFHIDTNIVPAGLIESDPLLKGCKVFGEEWNSGFMYDIRSFLKGDGGKLESFAWHLLGRGQGKRRVNYLASHDSFTVNDMVSYQMKHNEANGEENGDGDSYNCTWNCGAEGATLKKDVNELRLKQIKNAWTMLMFSQGIPMLMAGDEFRRTTKGNNNPYCQDNEISWVNWHLTEKNLEVLDFVKMLIKFRKKHTILCSENELRENDWKYYGYPDVSLHGEEAWKPDCSWEGRMLGVMYNERYSKGTDEFVYLAVNMHWEEQKLALPRLPERLKWKCISSSTDKISDDAVTIGERRITLEPRSVYILVAR